MNPRCWQQHRHFFVGVRIIQIPAIQVSSVDQEYQHHLEACWKCRVSGSTPTSLNQNLYFNKTFKWFVWTRMVKRHSALGMVFDLGCKLEFPVELLEIPVPNLHSRPIKSEYLEVSYGGRAGAQHGGHLALRAGCFWDCCRWAAGCSVVCVSNHGTLGSCRGRGEETLTCEDLKVGQCICKDPKINDATQEPVNCTNYTVMFHVFQHLTWLVRILVAMKHILLETKLVFSSPYLAEM